jgi:hypothetical protein
MVISVDDAVAMVAQRDLFMARVMRSGVDYGVIPGTGSKPTLLKPGAERLLAAYGLHPELEDETAPVIDIDGAQHSGEPFIQFRRRCRVWRQTGPGEADRMLIAQASGECNSWESRYRYRWTGSGDNRKRTKNEDPADQLNTILKMADKRAMVAAAILATNWSDCVTQDLEDGTAGSGSGERQMQPERRSDSSEEDFGPCTEAGCAGRLVARAVKVRGKDKRIVKCTNERYNGRGSCERKADFEPNWQWYSEHRDRAEAPSVVDSLSEPDSTPVDPSLTAEEVLATVVGGGPLPHTEAPPAGSVGGLVALADRATQRIADLARIDRVKAAETIKRFGYRGEPKSPALWVQRITSADTLADLIQDLDTAIELCPNEIPT